MIEEETASFLEWWEHLRIVPTISARSPSAPSTCVSTELDRTLRRLDATPDQRDQLDAMTRALVRRILHDPIATLRQHGDREVYLAAVRELFQLDDEGEPGRRRRRRVVGARRESLDVLPAARHPRLATGDRRRATSRPRRCARADPALGVEYVLVRTEGDVDRTSPLHQIGGRGVFVRAVEQALLDGRADIAMHSLKDVPTAPVEGLTLAAILPRGDPRDVLVASEGRRLAELPSGARVGIGSVRRRLLLRALRPDLELADIRGNVDTRVGKVASGEYDAVVIAAAGLDRLGRLDEATQVFEALEFLPSPGQGAIAVQCREDDRDTAERLRSIDDAGTRAAVEAERGFLAELGAGCTLPVGAYAQVDGDLVALRAMLGDDAGEHARFGDAAGPASDSDDLGRGLARQLLAPPPTNSAP